MNTAQRATKISVTVRDKFAYPACKAFFITVFLLFVLTGVAIMPPETQAQSTQPTQPTQPSQVPSPLRSPNNRGEYIIITHPQFTQSIQQFAAWRRGKGLDVRIIETPQIYAEFIDSTARFMQREAIRSFISYALQNWQKPAPQYFLLVGSTAHIPSFRVRVSDPTFTAPELLRDEDSVSLDEMFVVNKYVQQRDSRPQAAIGRFPARVADDVANIVEKTIRFEDQGRWMRFKYDFVGITDVFDADMFEVALEDFFQYTSAIQTRFRGRPFRVREINYRQRSANPGNREDIFRSIMETTMFVTYYGHGAPNLWSDARIMTTEDVDARFTNTQPFIMTSVGCSQNFDAARTRSIVERMINGKFGAVATYAASGFSDLAPNNLLQKAFYEYLLKSPNETLGLASLKAKRDQYYPDNAPEDYIFRRNTLLGDPALKIPYTVLTSVQTAQTQDDHREQQPNIVIAPNPVSSVAQVSYTLSAPATVRLRLLNALGQTIWSDDVDNVDGAAGQYAGRHVFTLDMSHFASGMYVLQLHYGSHIVSKPLHCLR
jgi:hypothetical protein